MSVVRTVKKCGRLALGTFAGLARLADSPTFTRELRTRLRGGRAQSWIFGYTTIISLFATGYLLTFDARTGSATGVSWMLFASVGRELFVTLAAVQLALVIVSAPGLTCSAISGEWEQSTLEALMLTTSSNRSLIIGKFAASLGYTGLLLFCSLPVFMLTINFGGISPLEIAVAYLITLTAGAFFGSLGLLASALCNRTYVAAGLAYGLMLFWLVGIPLATLSSVALVLFGGLGLAAALTAVARWWLPRRYGKHPERVTYLAIFGLSYCAVVGLVDIPGFTDTVDTFLQMTMSATNPFVMLLGAVGIYSGTSYGAGYYPGMPGAPGGGAINSFFSSLVTVLIFAGMSFLGTVAALAATMSLFRVRRAPKADSYETLARVEEEFAANNLAQEDAA